MYADLRARDSSVGFRLREASLMRVQSADVWFEEDRDSVVAIKNYGIRAQWLRMASRERRGCRRSDTGSVSRGESWKGELGAEELSA